MCAQKTISDIRVFTAETIFFSLLSVVLLFRWQGRFWWNQNQPLSFDIFVNTDYGQKQVSTLKYITRQFEYCFVGNEKMESMHNETLMTFYPNTKNNKSCTAMKMINLAEPQWINIQCDTKILCDVMCTVTSNFSANSWDANNQTMQRMTKCPQQYTLKQGKCFLFSWFRSLQPKSKNMHHLFARREKMFLGNFFESFQFLFSATSSQFPPILKPHKFNNSLMHAYSYKKYLMIFDCTESIVWLSEALGFVISVHKKEVIVSGLIVFKCTKGGYIVFQHRCDGTKDCPHDNSDEDNCSCRNREGRTDETNIYCREFIGPTEKTCGPLYFMNPKGNCKMYLPDKMYSRTKNNLNAEIREKRLYNLQENIRKNMECNQNSQLLCASNDMMCFNISSICLYKTNEFEEIIPCNDGSHLHNCHQFDCDVNFKCKMSHCVLWQNVWDGQWDCPNGDDEYFGQANNKKRTCKGMLKCKGKQKLCIHLGNICDGSHNCPEIEDELFCKLHKKECLSQCSCLGFTLFCVNTTATSLTSYDAFLFVKITCSDLSHLKELSFQFSNAVFVSLVKSKITHFCLTKYPKYILILDVSHNLITETQQNCFFDLPNVKVICLNNNPIHAMKNESFVDLPNLFFLNFSHNYLIAFPSNILHKCPSVKIINIEYNKFEIITKTFLVDLHVDIIITDNYHLCCVTSSTSECFAKGPWHFLCTDLLPEKTMRTTFIVLSAVSCVLNLASISVHAIRGKSIKKAFAISVIFINIGDFFCPVYLAVIWITDLVYQGSFMISEEKWRSSVLCFMAHGIILWFVLLTQVFLLFLSISRLQIVVQPMDTIFKKASFVLKTLTIISALGVLLAIGVTLFAQFGIEELPTNLCLPLVDPTHTLLMTKILVWFVACTQTLSFSVMTMFHILLVQNLLQSQKKIRQAKSHLDSNKVLFTQLILTTISNMVCWFPVNSIYIVVMFLWRYPMSVIFWSTVAMMPINSIVYPAVFTVLWMKKACSSKK